MQNIVRSISRERYAHLDDIWYVGRARAEGAHGECWAWHMLVPCWSPGTAGVKNVEQSSMTTKLGQKNR